MPLRFFLFLFSLLISISVIGQEICDNGIDDDNDGLIDLNDDDCECTGFGNTSTLESLIPNSSFEDRTCCPSGYSALNCANTWIQASDPTSDYWNTCDIAGSAFDGGAALPPPDGTGFVGFIHMSGWQEYIGACLNETMVAGQEYDLSFFMGYTNNSPALDLTFYGTPNCGDLPFSGNDCPLGQGGWIELGQVTVGGPLGWEAITVTFTPGIDINALVMGGACGSGGARTYYYMDDMSLVSTELFEVLNLDRTGKWCDDDILLTASKDTAIGDYQWYKNGVALVGQTTANLDVSGSGLGEGDYTIALYINGQCETKSTTVTAPELPVANASNTNVCLLGDVDFTDQSTLTSGNITNWDWDFGDNNSSTNQNPSYEYTTDGTFNVSLTVTTDSNCVDVWQGTATVYPNPVADFNTDNQCLYNAAEFEDQSTINNPDNVATWQWDFGDANVSALSNPSNNYITEGNYDVELIVNSNNGCADTIVQPITLYAAPLADFTFDTVCAELTTTFADASAITVGTINSYQWTFGNTDNSVLQNPTTIYADGGAYTTKLLVVSDQGCRDSITYSVPVFPKPTAEFNFTDACLNEANIFIDQSSINIGAISEWEWDFGDNTQLAPDQNPIYIYAASGQYTVNLTATTLNGCTDNISHTVEVNELPTADFTFTNICEDDSVQFTNLSSIPSGTITSWQWNFGNTNTSSVELPVLQTYPADALYPVSLIVSSGFGCSDTLENTIEIYPVPIADFSFDSVCFPLEIQFTDLSNANGSYDITTWLWTFSDTQVSPLQSPSIDFGMPGTFSAELLISNGPGCKSTFNNGDAVVHPLPVADFPSGLAICLEDTIFFTDQSDITPITNDVIDTWLWTLDDGDFITTQDGLHIYENPNLYNVQLAVQTNNGCTDNTTRVVEIYPLPNVDFSADPTEGCQPLAVQFLNQSSISAPYSIASWNWTLGLDSASTTSQNPFLTYNPEIAPLDIATFDIGLTATSANGCVSEIFRPNYITVYPKPDALFSVDEDVKSVLKPLFQFTDLSSENVTAWDWNFGDGFFAAEQNPRHAYSEIGIYPIILITETEYGCLDTIDYEVKVEPIFTFYIPNSFTPDADGINDEFFGLGEGYTSYQMWIYDRWGEMIFFSENQDYHWDGTYNGQQVQQGTFIYRFYLLDWQGHDHQYKGHVTLHR